MTRTDCLPPFDGDNAVTLKFYEHPLSPYARKVKIVLYEKDIPFERVIVTPLVLKEGDAGFAEFAAASPRLEVPCLADGAFHCFDSTIILDYVDERWQGRPMLPAKPEERARARMVEEICDTELEAINWGLMEIRVARRASGEQAEGMAARSGERLAQIWDRFERELADRAWFSGDDFGRADAALIVHVSGSTFFGFAPQAGRHDALRAWADRSLSRPSVQRDAADLGAFMSTDKTGRFVREGSGFARQYRDHRLEWMMKSGGADIVLRGIENGSIHFAKGF